MNRKKRRKQRLQEQQDYQPPTFGELRAKHLVVKNVIDREGILLPSSEACRLLASIGAIMGHYPNVRPKVVERMRERYRKFVETCYAEQSYDMQMMEQHIRSI